MKLNHLLTIMGLITALVTTSCNRRVIERKPDTSSSRVLIDWNIAAFEAMGGATYQQSLMASRINAMVHIAMHDAINAVQPKFEQYAYKQTVPSANMEAAAVYAAYTVLSASFPAKKQMLDSILSISMTGIEDGDSKTKGIEVGVDAAHAILHKRAGDGADINPVVAIPASNIPGVYNVVPPFDFVFAPHWKTMRLFGLKKHNQFRPGAPPSLNSTTYIEDLNEVKAVGEKNSTTRTADQTFYSQFWYEFSEAGWNRVARTCINDKKLGIAEGARLLALLNMALADALTDPFAADRMAV